jgi:AcrR family transcriptional regulator
MAAIKKLSPVRTAMRSVVVEAAARCFFRSGYAGSTMEAIAAEAGVSVQTLYNSVGNKAAFLAAVFEMTVSGPNAPQPVPVFMRERTGAAADARGVVRVLSEWFLESHTRMAPVWKLVEEGAGHDDDVAAFARKRAHQRLTNYQEAAKDLHRRGGLRKGLGFEEAAAIIWSIGHPQVFRTLVLEAKWDEARYVGWLESSLAAALLRC